MEIRIDGVEKYYGNFKALGPISFEIKEKGITTILGPNGAGKTTLLKVLTGLAFPKKGEVKINGMNYTDSRKKILMNMGVLIEQPEFYPYLDGLEILEFTGKLRGFSGESLKNEIERVSAITGSTNFLKKKVGKYSRGMKQRLGLAVALIGDPSILILDEPTFGIDPMGILEIRSVLRSLNEKKEKIIIFTTHIIEEAMALSDRIIILDQGRISRDIRNDSDTVLLKLTGKFRKKDILQKYKMKEISQEQIIIEVPKEEIAHINRIITNENDIFYIEKSSRVEEVIREISSNPK